MTLAPTLGSNNAISFAMNECGQMVGLTAAPTALV